MNIKELYKRPNIEQDKKLKNKYIFFNKLINELKKKEIPSAIVTSVNRDIEGINSFSGSNKDLLKQLRKAESSILKLIEQELKLVTINHYRNRLMALGIAFGVSLGVAFGASSGNMAFIGIGIPIGMVIGLAVGTAMDNKANENGNQLDVEIER